jgi:iron complex transport system ATP-binding protein
MTILAGERISVHRGTRRVLVDADVEVARGELVGLLGPNGAGKTTLLKALSGLLPCTGRATFEGRDIRAMTPDERSRRIAFLPQTIEAHWPMPVTAVVALGRLPHRRHFMPPALADHDAVQNAMAQTDVTSLASRRLNSLSGGELARVFLARALAVEAPVLLADEPVSHLDPGHQLAVLDLFRQRADRGDAVIVVLHDLGYASRYCHRIYVLDQGVTVAQGRPTDVLTDDLLHRVYGISAARTSHDGQSILVPWRVARP